MTDKFISGIKLSRFFFPVLLLLLLTFFSCKDDPTGLGSDLIPGDENPGVGLDTTEIVLSNQLLSDTFKVQYIDSVKYDTIISHSPYAYYNLVGEYDDEIFGRTSAGLMFELSAPGYTSIDQSKQYSVLSLRFYLGKSTQNSSGRMDTVVLGQKTGANKLYFDLYTLDKNLSRTFTSPFYFYSNIDPEQYRGRSIQLAEHRLAYNKDSLNFEITDQNLKDVLLEATKDSSSLSNSTAFSSYLKGLYIKVSNPSDLLGQGALFSVDLMNYDKTYLEMKLRSSQDTITLKYRVRGLVNGVSNYVLDNTGSRSATDQDHYFVQGLSGPFLKLSFPNLDTWKSLKPLTVYKAELILTPDSTFLKSGGVTALDYPDQLFLSLNNSQVYLDDYVLNSSYFGGTYANGAFRFNITKYFHRFIRENLTNSDMFLRVAHPALRSGTFDPGRVAFRKTDGIKLRIIYSKLNQ